MALNLRLKAGETFVTREGTVLENKSGRTIRINISSNNNKTKNVECVNKKEDQNEQEHIRDRIK